MSNDYRNESRRSAPSPKYGTPGTQYPTPNPYDLVITEEVTNRAQAFEPVLFGTPHPTVVAAVLCYQGQVKGGNTDKAPVRIYANPRLAQEPYNLVNGGGDANDPTVPIFVRSYLLPRGYTKGTAASPLSALIGLTIGGGGTGYAAANDSPGYGKISLSFSGGSGTGAAGFAEVAAGVIVAAVLTNSGTGYTSAPTVSVSGGSGGSITALIQPQAALLTKEEEQPAEEPYSGYFVRVTRTWETMPGVELIRAGYDDETGARMRVVRQRVVSSTLPVARAASRTFNTIPMFCVDSYLEPEGSGFGTLVTVYMELPPTRTLKGSRAFPCPSIFSFITGWVIPNPPFHTQGPYAGVNYDKTGGRTAVQTETEISYTVAQSVVAMPDVWTVSSPGDGSKFLPIGNNTIHNAVFLDETSGLSTQTIEDIAASEPSSYTPGQDMIIRADEAPWKHSVFWERQIETAFEPT